MIHLNQITNKVHLILQTYTKEGGHSEASMGGGYTQNIQVKDSSNGQMITQTVTQEMIDSNPSLMQGLCTEWLHNIRPVANTSQMVIQRTDSQPSKQSFKRI